MITIAVSGKGGTGKTTVAAAIVRWLGDNVSRSVLAVDADANVNLNDVLGVELKGTVGGIREEMKALAGKLPGGMSKQQFFEYKIQTSLTETPAFDFLAMGRPEGPGCYCYANNLLRDILATLSGNYGYVVIDNEAGMEHLSRRTSQNIDALLILSDPTCRGIRAAGKISRLLAELDTRVGKRFLLLNRVEPLLPEAVTAVIEEEGLALLGAIPEDRLIRETDRLGQPVWSILPQTSLYRSVGDFMAAILKTGQPERGPK